MYGSIHSYSSGNGMFISTHSLHCIYTLEHNAINYLLSGHHTVFTLCDAPLRHIVYMIHWYNLCSSPLHNGPIIRTYLIKQSWLHKQRQSSTYYHMILLKTLHVLYVLAKLGWPYGWCHFYTKKCENIHIFKARII